MARLYGPKGLQEGFLFQVRRVQPLLRVLAFMLPFQVPLSTAKYSSYPSQ